MLAAMAALALGLLIPSGVSAQTGCCRLLCVDTTDASNLGCVASVSGACTQQLCDTYCATLGGCAVFSFNECGAGSVPASCTGAVNPPIYACFPDPCVTVTPTVTETAEPSPTQTASATATATATVDTPTATATGTATATPIPTGACCAQGTECRIATEADCDGAGDRYAGDGTTCDPNACLATLTPTGSATPTATRTRVPDGGNCVEPADCRSLRCIEGVCQPNPSRAPTASTATLAIGLAMLIVLGAIGLARIGRG